jgi:uncharacterized lipoprotein YajG
MKKAIMLLAVLALAGCKEQVEIEHKTNTYTVDGKPLMCFSLSRRMSCNWELYNE